MVWARNHLMFSHNVTEMIRSEPIKWSPCYCSVIDMHKSCDHIVWVDLISFFFLCSLNKIVAKVSCREGFVYLQESCIFPQQRIYNALRLTNDHRAYAFTYAHRYPDSFILSTTNWHLLIHQKIMFYCCFFV